MDTESEQPQSGQPPTEWHALTFQEMLFAQTHARLMLSIAGDPPATRLERMIEESRNLLYIHRGTAIAAWIMEHARRTGRLPGHDGEPLEPCGHEKIQLAADRPGHQSLGPKPDGCPLSDQDYQDAFTVAELRERIKDMPDDAKLILIERARPIPITEIGTVGADKTVTFKGPERWADSYA